MLQDQTPEFPSHRLFGPSRLARALTVAAVLAAVGCAHTIPLKPTVERPPEVVQAPVAVGVFYSQEFREYKHSAWRGGDRWDFDLGPASVQVLDRAFPALFESVVPVVSRPPLPAAGPRLAAVIEPKIEQFDFGLPFLKTGLYSAEITYRFTLYSADGPPIVSWTVRGEAAKPGQMGFEFDRWPGEAADLAMQQAATRLMTTFRELPEIRGWLRQVGATGARWAPHRLFTTVADKE